METNETLTQYLTTMPLCIGCYYRFLKNLVGYMTL